MLKIYANHIDRCTSARLESYQKAFNEVSRPPTETELNEVFEEFKLTWELQIRHSTQALGNFMATRNLPAGVDVSSNLRSKSAHGHDRVLQDWKIWRDKVFLRGSITDLEPSTPVKIAALELQSEPTARHDQASPGRGSIWSHFFGWKVLFGWSVVGWAQGILVTSVLALIAIGYSVPVNNSRPWFVGAQAVLAVAAILFLVKVIEIAVIMDHPFGERAMFTVALFGMVGLLTTEGIRGISKIRPKPETKEQTAPPPVESSAVRDTFQPAGFISFLGQVINGAAPMIQINQTDTPLDDVRLIVTQSLPKSDSDPGPWPMGWQKEIEIGTCRAKLTIGLADRFPVGGQKWIRFDITMLTRLRTHREII